MTTMGISLSANFYKIIIISKRMCSKIPRSNFGPFFTPFLLYASFYSCNFLRVTCFISHPALLLANHALCKWPRSNLQNWQATKYITEWDNEVISTDCSQVPILSRTGKESLTEKACRYFVQNGRHVLFYSATTVVIYSIQQ